LIQRLRCRIRAVVRREIAPETHIDYDWLSSRLSHVLAVENAIEPVRRGERRVSGLHGNDVRLRGSSSIPFRAIGAPVGFSTTCCGPGYMGSVSIEVFLIDRPVLVKGRLNV
jgi:hypothetical protein